MDRHTSIEWPYSPFLVLWLYQNLSVHQVNVVLLLFQRCCTFVGCGRQSSNHIESHHEVCTLHFLLLFFHFKITCTKFCFNNVSKNSCKYVSRTLICKYLSRTLICKYVSRTLICKYVSRSKIFHYLSK